MSLDAFTVDYYVDCHGHDCYRICMPDGLCSIVSSAHLIEGATSPHVPPVPPVIIFGLTWLLGILAVTVYLTQFS